MKKIISVVLLLISSTFIGLSSSNAVIQCPSNTTISDIDPTKCISLTVPYSPADKASISSCPNNAYLNASNMCVTAGIYVPPGTYSGSPRYVFWCSGGVPPSSDGYCHTPLNPPIVNSVYSPGVNTYICNTYPYLSLSVTNCYSINNYSQNIPATISGVSYPSCTSGYTRNGDNCQKSITEILSNPTQYIDGYDCNGVLSASSTCTTSGFQNPDVLSDPVISYSGTCQTYTTINKTTGMCMPYTFDPSEPIQQTIFKCFITGWGNTSEIAYYNYDSSVVAPFGKSITCSPVTSSVESETSDGIYYCNSTNLVSGNIFYYASDVDATGSTSVVVTSCEFSVNEFLNNVEFEDIPITELDTSCDNIYTYEFLLQCLASKYV